MAPLVTFLSDFGLDDEFVGVCHAVIVGRCPQARIVDLGHGVPPQDVRAGAVLLSAALPYTPPGIHLAVVDPGVGTDRRAVAIRTAREGRILVGPDNGLLALAAERFGGAAEAYDIGAAPVRAARAAPTFHGRDLFAPVVGALAAGASLAQLGRPVDPATLKPLLLPAPERASGRLTATVVLVDRYGNLSLWGSAEDLAAASLKPGELVTVSHGGRSLGARYAATYGEVAPGEGLLYIDSRELISVAVREGSASRVLAVSGGEEVRIER